jgi:O-antigen ligase
VTGTLATRLLPAAIALAAGLLAAMAALTLPGLGRRALGGLIGAAGVAALVLLTRRPVEVLAGSAALALTYNRQYFEPFASLTGIRAGEGLFWIPADPLLAALLFAVALERALGRAPATAPAAFPAWPALPFLAACLVSTLVAERMDLAAAETLRVAKFALLLALLSRRMDAALWRVLVVALAAGVLVQSALGTLQVAFRAGDSLVATFGGTPETQAEGFENRARGTLGHPNMLAPWLLMLAPGAFGLALFSRSRALRAAGLLLTLAAMAGIFAAKSRAPGLLLLAALGGVALGAVLVRALPARAAAAGTIWGALLLGAALAPFAGDIAARFQGDFARSVTFRADYNRAALEVFEQAPLLGAGLSGSGARMAELSPLIASELAAVSALAHSAGVRASAPVHNVYILILAEAGLLGLMAFLLLLGAILWRGASATLRCTGGMRGIALGLTFGLGAQAIQQLVDFSLWWDPSWFTLAIVAALLGTAPALDGAVP